MSRWGRVVDIPGFGKMFIDGSGPRPEEPKNCHYCQEPSVALCDWPVKTHKSGTCDRKLCGKHAGQPVPEFGKQQDIDYCPPHYEMYKAAKMSNEERFKQEHMGEFKNVDN